MKRCSFFHSQLRKYAFCGLVLLISASSPAQAHFLWLTPSTSSGKIAPAEGHSVLAHFSESPFDPEPDLVPRIADLKIRRPQDDKPLALKKIKDGLLVDRDMEDAPVVFAEQNFGVMSRGKDTFRLQYHAKALLNRDLAKWNATPETPPLLFDAFPKVQGNEVVVECRWNGKPLPNAEVTTVIGDSDKAEKFRTDDAGTVHVKAQPNQLLALRVKHVEPKSGTIDGKAYSEERHYLTLTFVVPEISTAAQKPVKLETPYPQMVQGVTSFGAAIVGDKLYVFGGNIGKAHDYYVGAQVGTFRELSLQPNSTWKDLPSSTPLQGVSLVPYQGKLYRVGGFAARNPKGKPQDLRSTAEFSFFDPVTNSWNSLPPMPQPRSSHDTVVLDGKLYVVGGWALKGDSSETEWHNDALCFDLNKPAARWEELPAPAFEIRAFSLAALPGKLYVIGGMSSDNEATTSVRLFDIQTGNWSDGPALPGKPMEGFGVSAIENKGRLYVCGMGKTLFRLAQDGKRWEDVGGLPRSRFFHRMLPTADGHLLLVGGAEMKTGKVLALELLTPE